MGHSHDSGATLTGRRLSLSIFITLTFVLVEGIAGYFAGSLSLLSDAGHNFADGLALIFTWYGIRIARRPSTAQRTFGYHRVGILAAPVNAVALVIMALLEVEGCDPDDMFCVKRAAEHTLVQHRHF